MEISRPQLTLVTASGSNHKGRPPRGVVDGDASVFAGSSTAGCARPPSCSSSSRETGPQSEISPFSPSPAKPTTSERVHTPKRYKLTTMVAVDRCSNHRFPGHERNQPPSTKLVTIVFAGNRLLTGTANTALLLRQSRVVEDIEHGARDVENGLEVTSCCDVPCVLFSDGEFQSEVLDNVILLSEVSNALQNDPGVSPRILPLSFFLFCVFIVSVEQNLFKSSPFP
ncbi:hypothetical protein V8G54_011097 [Vigna mungo]|uniref:Uncharacterized protein n=1 Tax=Vigna mungo TaxID=3915 RepID=A0AAQ3S2L9_VIGMU